jgi:hypothetical protein
MAIINKNQFNLLSTRAGFNSALRHFKTALGFSDEVEEGYNLADVLNTALDDKAIADYQLMPIINILLADKFGYTFRSENLKERIESADNIIKATSAWNNLQIVLVYYNSSGDIILLNPANKSHWDNVLPLHEDELMVCFVGSLEPKADKKIQESAVADIFALLGGANVKEKKGYSVAVAVKQVVRQEAPVAPSPVQSSVSSYTQTEDAKPVVMTGRQNMTTKYAVNVTNELFHNGNVEAWKRIIESYKASYPGTEVHVWYEGEKINDINALFKWGKVKHGCPIMFGVSGEAIKDISKLRKYLFEGASPRFEAFLHGHPGSLLELF